MRETETWPFVQAKNYTQVDPSAPRTVAWIVIHTMEAPEKGDTAEQIAKYFATMPDGRIASAHVTIDDDSVVQCVHDRDVAYGAPGANRNGIHLELAGYAKQTLAEWQDTFSTKLLKKAANVAAQYCLKFDIPARRLSQAELLAGAKGIVGHCDITKCFPRPGGAEHVDPGPYFPWDWFLSWVRFYIAEMAK